MDSEMSLAKTSIKWFIFSVITAIISFVGMVYFSRKLGAQSLGIYFLFMSVLTVFNLITNMGLQAATIKRISEGVRQSEIAAASLMLRLGVFALCALAILVFRGQIDHYMGAGLSYYLILILGLTQFSDIIREILHGEQKVDIGGAFDLAQQFLRVLFQSFLILLGFEIFGLVIGLGIGVLISLFIGSRLIDTGLKMPKKSHFNSLLTFSKFSLGNAVGGYLYEWIGIVIIGLFLTQQHAGIYGVAWGLSAVFLLLSQAISSSIYPKISDFSSGNRKQEIAGIFSESLVYSPLLVIPAFFGTLVISKNLLGAIYGKDFEAGYLVLVILMLARVFQSMQMISVRTLEGMDLPDVVFKINLVTTILNVFGILLLVHFFGFAGAAMGTMVTILVSFVWNTKVVCRMLDIKIPFKDMAYEIFSAVAMGLIVFVFSKLFPQAMVRNLILTVFVGGVLYFIILFTLSERIKSKCLLIIKEVTHKTRG